MTTEAPNSGELVTGHAPHSPLAPGGVCLACYNTSERYRRPFVVVCMHRERVVEVLGGRRYRTWPITPAQLLELVRLLEGGTGEADR